MSEPRDLRDLVGDDVPAEELELSGVVAAVTTFFAYRLDLLQSLGQWSQGSFATGLSPTEIEGKNTVEGDIDNDSTATDGVLERQRERTNS